LYVKEVLFLEEGFGLGLSWKAFSSLALAAVAVFLRDCFLGGIGIIKIPF
jgi:hypothetical protein